MIFYHLEVKSRFCHYRETLPNFTLLISEQWKNLCLQFTSPKLITICGTFTIISWWQKLLQGCLRLEQCSECHEPSFQSTTSNRFCYYASKNTCNTHKPLCLILNQRIKPTKEDPNHTPKRWQSSEAALMFQVSQSLYDIAPPNDKVTGLKHRE